MVQPTSNLLSALAEAKVKGFPQDFHLTEDGHFLSSSGEVSPFKIIEMVPCLRCGTTLYLIAGKDQQGTWVHFWDL